MLNLSCISPSQRPHCVAGRLRRGKSKRAGDDENINVTQREPLWRRVVLSNQVISLQSDTDLAYEAGVRKGRGRELGRETACEGGGERLQASLCFRHPAY